MHELEINDLPTLEGLEEILLNLSTEQIDCLNDFYGVGLRAIWQTVKPEMDIRAEYEKAIAAQNDDRNFLMSKIFERRLSGDQQGQIKKIRKIANYVANLRHVEPGAEDVLEHVAQSLATVILAREVGVEISKTDLAILLNAWLVCNFPLS
jgi:hypothetical protein